MFYFPVSGYIVYPGCGIDFSPLLLESYIAERHPKFLDELRKQWSLSTLLLCDNSSSVISHFNNLKPDDFIFDKKGGVLNSEEKYRSLWLDSELEYLKVLKTAEKVLPEKDSKGENFSVREFTLEAGIKGMKAAAIVVFFPYDFKEVVGFLDTVKYNASVNGLILLGLNQIEDFYEYPVLKNSRFIIADVAPNEFSDQFLPVHFKFKNLGMKQRVFSTGASLLLNHFMFSTHKLDAKDAMWVIPGLFAVSYNANQVFDNDEYNLIHLKGVKKDTGSIKSYLDQIDASIKDNRAVLVYEDGQKDKVGLIVGCWLVRHSMASGMQVKAHLNTLGKIARIEGDIYPNDEESRVILSNWRLGE